MPSSAILLVETDPSAGDLIAGVLSRVGYNVTTVADRSEALARAAEHRLVIIDVLPGADSAAELCGEVRATPALSSIPVLCVSALDDVEERIRFLEAGADDVMARPFDARELEARVEALLLRFQRTRDRTPLATSAAGEPACRAVAFFSPKGGVGTTTLAVNVATAAAANRPNETLIVDLALQWGQVATHLNVKPASTIADLARDEQAQHNPELLRTYATVTGHGSGLWVLAAPASPALAELVTGAHVEQILKTSLEAFDRVIIDAGSVLDERSLAALDAADRVIVPIYPEIPALRAVVGLLEYLNDSGSVALKATFVLNEMFAKELVKVSQVEGSLGVKISATIPHDAFLYLKAANEGIPVVQSSPRSLPAERLAGLASSVFGDLPGVLHPAVPEVRRGLFGLRKRA